MLHCISHFYPGTKENYPDSRRGMPAGLTTTLNGLVDYAAISHSGGRFLPFFTWCDGGLLEQRHSSYKQPTQPPSPSIALPCGTVQFPKSPKGKASRFDGRLCRRHGYRKAVRGANNDALRNCGGGFGGRSGPFALARRCSGHEWLHWASWRNEWRRRFSCLRRPC